MPGSRASLEDRLWRHVEKSEGGCWLWHGAIQPNGYGVIGVKIDGKHRTRVAHRQSWEIHFGRIPDGMKVCHSCDNPSCVNPEHLFLGTQADNIADMMAKRREARGSRRGCSKLTAAQVLEARHLFGMEGVCVAELARRFGVCHTTMKSIIYYQTWNHV